MSHLTAADAAWLHMERPDNLMNINGLLFFKGEMRRDRLEALLEHRFCGFERFRMKVVENPLGVGPPSWQLDEEFSLKRHLIFEDLHRPDLKKILHRTGQLMSEPLDRRHPLWEFRVFPGVEGGSVIVARLHHAIGDGIALMRVLLALCDTTPEPTERPSRVPRQKAKRNLLERAKTSLSHFLHTSHHLLFHPQEAAGYAELGKKAGASLKRLLTLPPDAPNPFRAPLSTRKVAALSPPIPLLDFKEPAKRLGCTVNDLLMGTLSGAFRRALLTHGNLSSEAELRVVVPVDLRGGEISDLGNRFGLVFLPLAVGLSSPSERVCQVHQAMTELKNSAEAVVAFELLSTVGMVPEELEKPIIQWFGEKASAVVTNLPGPREKLYLAGAELESVMYWVPQSGALALGISLMSYAGQVRLGVASDAAVLPNPEEFIDHFLDEFRELSLLEVL